MLAWIENHQGLMWSLGAASIVILIASVVIIPALVVRIRHDYFTHATRPPGVEENQRPSVRLAILIGKNVLGGILMLAGIAMFVLPGQGLLTLLVGFFLIDFPGKYRVEKWLIAQSFVRRPIDWLRVRRGRPPLQVAQ